MSLHLPATIVFVALFLFVTWLGFVAARWRKADLNLLKQKMKAAKEAKQQ